MSSSIRKARYHCAAEAAVGVLGGRWKLLVLSELVGGPRRFSELAAALPATSDKVLTAQLRELEEDGVIGRVVHYEFPPRVEYALGPASGGVVDLIGALDAWGERFLSTRPDLRAPPGD